MNDLGIDEETLAQLMELGVLDDQGNILDQQIQQASALRGSPGPQGRQAGNFYMAANPLEHAAHALQGYKAQNDMEEMRKAQQEMLTKQTEGRKKFAEQLLGGQQQPQQDLFDLGVF